MSLVSIIIPCFNYGWLLPETLESVIKQNYKEWECIIVDDGSIDDTRQVAESFVSKDDRFSYIYQVNGGMSNARNNGLRRAKGDYIQFLDSDDLLAPDKLATQIAYMQDKPEIDILYGDVRFFTHGNVSVISRSFDMRDTPWIRRVEGKGEEVIRPLVEYNDIVINSPIVRTSLIQSAGLFDEQLKSVEDWDFWLRCAIKGARFKYLPTDANAWALVRVHVTSTSQNRARMLDYTFQMRWQLAKVLAQTDNIKAAKYNQNALQLVVEQQAVASFARGDRKEGIRKFWLLARMSNRYVHCIRSGIYWLRQRSIVDKIS